MRRRRFSTPSPASPRAPCHDPGGQRFLPERFDEFVSHLALGIEPIDALSGGRLPSALSVTFDPTPGAPQAISRPWLRVRSHPSLVYVLLYDKRLKAPVQLRFRRRVAPLRAAADPLRDGAHARRRPRRRGVHRTAAFFPAAAYGVSGTATGVRGRAVWRAPGVADVPIPWVGSEAK